MVDTDRRPTALEIEELIDLVQRDPASPAFIDLGEAYLALGRPRDALGVGGVGLDAAPDSLEGRVMVARAYAALHQWKEAQGELLRVVKIDRSNRRGFALLGEVLLRRNDFERAVPVLQHAQNLDPTSPQILQLLKRARSGQPLDPPPPLPTPVPPRGETDSEEFVERARSPGPTARAKPTPPAMAVPTGPRSAPRVAQAAVAMAPAPAKLLSQPPAQPPAQPPQPPVPPAQPLAARSGPIPAQAKQAQGSPPPAPPPARPAPADDDDAEPTTRDGLDEEPTVDHGFLNAAPTVVSTTRPEDLLASMRGDATLPSVPPTPVPDPPARKRVRDARPPATPDLAAATANAIAPSETFLNDLLTANNPVHQAAPGYDPAADKSWGRSARLVFGILFGLFVIGASGGGFLYWYTEKLNREAVAQLQNEAKTAIASGDYTGLTTSIAKLAEALDKDRTNSKTLAYAVETAGLDALLYGVPTEAADQAIAKLGSDVGPDDDGWRELVLGKAAVQLSRLGVVDAGRSAGEVAKIANSTLVEVGKQLDDFLKTSADDKWAKWLRGRALLAAGKRKDATAAFDDAIKGEDGLVVAMIDRAALYGDDGALDDALALYDKVLKKSPNHPLAVLGKALVRTEEGIDASAVIDDIAMTVANKTMGSRVTAYRALATGLAELGIEDYAKANDQLATAVAHKPLVDSSLCASGPAEPRFWAAIAWGAYTRGDLAGTATARSCVAWYGKEKAEDDPAVVVVDAALAAASGHPEKTLAIAAALQSNRARLLRLDADLELGKLKDALTEAADLVKRTTPADGDVKHANLAARILDAQARFENAEVRERDAVASELDALARQAQSKLGHHALGMAYLHVGDVKNAQPALEDAVKDVTEQNPNPIAYRTHTALADLLISAANDEAVKQPDDAKDKLAQARSHLDAALKQDSAYDPALATEAKLVLREGDPDKAATLLDSLVNEVGGIDHVDQLPPGVQLTVAEVLITRKNPPPDTETAAKILRDIKDKIRVPADVGRVANLIDTKLPAELGVPVPPDAPRPPGAPTKGPTPRGGTAQPGHH